MNNQKEKDDLMLKKLRDPKFYLENFCKIKSKTGGLVPFLLNEAQKDLYNTLRTNERVDILKARQIGFSTAVTGFIYHKTIIKPGTTSAIVGYNSALTSELLDKVKTFYRTTPLEIRPTIQYNSKFEVSFPKIESKILVLPSSENVGRGYTFQNILCTETAFWEKAEDKMTAIENTVPVKGGLIVQETTPNGAVGYFYRHWMAKNDYAKRKYGWWWLYSQEEVDTIKSRMNNPRKFAQEYELEFLASGRLVFDQEVILKQKKNILKEGDIVKLDNGQDWMVKTEDKLRIYKPPVAGRMYVAGGDCSEGVEGGDYSTCTIIDRTSGEEVAFFKGLEAPDKFAELLDRWGRKYNNAMMVIEINNHGLTVVTELKKRIYPTMYFRPSKFETIASPWSDRLGWRTTKVTRPLMIDDFGQALREDAITLHSEETLDEMLGFIFNKNNDMQPGDGGHDDCIFSVAICYQGFKVLWDRPLTQLDYSNHLPAMGY